MPRRTGRDSGGLNIDLAYPDAVVRKPYAASRDLLYCIIICSLKEHPAKPQLRSLAEGLISIRNPCTLNLPCSPADSGEGTVWVTV